MIHKAKILQNSIENLGPNGMAFSVVCCDDQKTVQRHTIHKPHTLTDDELKSVLTRYVKEAAELHLAAERNHRRALEFSGQVHCEICE